LKFKLQLSNTAFKIRRRIKKKQKFIKTFLFFNSIFSFYNYYSKKNQNIFKFYSKKENIVKFFHVSVFPFKSVKISNLKIWNFFKKYPITYFFFNRNNGEIFLNKLAFFNNYRLKTINILLLFQWINLINLFFYLFL
jgi:hypothetical protein